jgi:heme A synthase
VGGVCVHFIHFRRLQRVKMDTRPKIGHGNDFHVSLWNQLLHRTRRKHLQMRNIIIVFLTIISGLTYGWCIVKYPQTAQIIAGGIGFGFLFLAMVALYETKNGGHRHPPTNPMK